MPIGSWTVDAWAATGPRLASAWPILHSGPVECLRLGAKQKRGREGE